MKRIKKSRDKTSELNRSALYFPSVFNIEEKIGINVGRRAITLSVKLGNKPKTLITRLDHIKPFGV